MTATALQANAQPVTGSGEHIAIPGARSIDHAGFAVRDLEQAITFFTDVLGAAVLWRSAPFSADGLSPKAPAGLNADPRAATRLVMLRLGPNLNVELIEYRPGAPPVMPLSSGLNVGHFAFDVDDINVAGAYLKAKNVLLLEGPRHNTEGPNTGQDSWFFLTPWGMAVELIHRLARMPYDCNTAARLFKASAQPESAMTPVTGQATFSVMDEEKKILRLENDRVQAMIGRDYATLERLMAPECVNVESNGTVRTTAEFMASFRAEKTTFDTFVIDENRVRSYGNSAVVTGQYHNVLSIDVRPQPVKYTGHTRVWAKQTDGNWQIVSHQATEMPVTK
ncbi:hypothetical protein GCM10027423_19960 [Spirosoma arcticum]